MEYTINETPFKMREIAAKLFNLEYLSDITFLVEGKKIYAHSLILMVRSNVFQNQLQTTFSDKKLIPITEYKYEVFYEFIQFIYTDQLNDVTTNWHHLLKLAIHYNVIRLVNHVMNRNFCGLQKLDWYKSGNCKIDVNRTCIKLIVAENLKYSLDLNEFKLIDSDTVAEILQFDEIGKGISESYILDALVGWMKHHCKKSQIAFSECRETFFDLIRLIRFPTMSSEELRNIKIKYPGLLTESDFKDIAIHKIYEAEYDDGIWNRSPRTELLGQYEWKTYPDKSEFKTEFSVSSDMILTGFVVGLIEDLTVGLRVKVTISCQCRSLGKITEININDLCLGYYGFISLGASIRLRPNYIYIIGLKYEPMDTATYYVSRLPQTDLFINGPSNSVKILEAHSTMIEISFAQP